MNGNLNQVYVTPENGNFWHTGTGILEDGTKSLTVSDDKQYWIYTPTTEGSKTIKVLELGGITGGTIFNKNNYKLTVSMTVNVEGNVTPTPSPSPTPTPKLTAQIIGPDVVKLGETPEYYLELKDENGNEIDRRVTWGGNGMSIANWDTGTGTDSKTKVSFYSPGEYTINASYHATSDKNYWEVVETITKTVKVIAAN